MLKIAAGRLGGRRIATPKGRATRPTSDKVRQAVFNVLASRLDLSGARAFDLYAGSGALGIEALSRGAAAVVWVESDRPTAELVKRTLAELEIGPAAGRIVVARALAWLAQPCRDAPATLILADPPYASADYPALLPALAVWPGAAAGAWIVLQAPAQMELAVPPGLELERVKRYGDTQVLFYRKADAAPVPGAGSTTQRA
jgi:16S rRNA (guanine966-N2)-methyltransferase